MNLSSIRQPRRPAGGPALPLYQQPLSTLGQTMKRTVTATLVGLCLTVLTARQTQAGLVFNVRESGGNVIFNMSGNVNLAATSGFFGGFSDVELISPAGGNIIIGPGSNPCDDYRTNVSWTSFGPGAGSPTLFSSVSGDRVALFSNPAIGVPGGYISGNPLSGTGTINGSTLASLGITPGTYVTTFSSSSSGVDISDTVTVIAQVPEPCGLVLGLTAGMTVLFARLRRVREQCAFLRRVRPERERI
jgi:hypothetical protein